MACLRARRSSAANTALDLTLFVCVALAGALAADTAEPSEQGLLIGDPWMRFIMPSRPAAGYFTLTNATPESRTLVGASSPACGALMLHQTVHKGGVDKMAMVKDISVPAHGSVTFAPGSYHLMCMSPSPQMIPGHSVAVTLRFADGGEISASFSVRGAAGTSIAPPR
ncbi:MAG TPA: copper chaperone PCu(A)C [Roseiarcus sp.]|nr:copper chaperone PCu(A)C [Roseiarcus sp.]